ncbi:tRNA (guanine-N(7)-)-methyltransferase (tRNA(m7G46)-methyltransferase) [Thecaphora frezii]
MSSPTPLWPLVAALLAPGLLVYLCQPRPWTVLLATPCLLLLCILSVPLLHLAAAFWLDRQWFTRSSDPTPWQDDLSTLRSVSRLSFLTPAAWSAHCTRLDWVRNPHALERQPIHPHSPQVSEAVDELLALIMRDFVNKWHTPLASGSDNPSPLDSAPEFPHAVEATIRHALLQLSHMVARLDIATLAVRKVLPQVTHHLDAFRKAEAALRGSSRSSALHSLGSDQVDLFLSTKYQDGRLHRAVGDMSSLDTKVAEQEHLRLLVSRILYAVLPVAEQRSQAVMVVVREILSCTILYPVIDMLSDPDFWNALLDRKAGDVIHEQKLVNKLREALDKQDAGSSAPTAAGNDLWPHPRDRKRDQRSFEAFMQSIAGLKSILEARRTKNDIAMQIRKTKAILEQLHGAEVDNKRAQLQIYVQRLEAAHGLAERKIAELSSGKGVAPFRGKAGAGADPTAARAKLRDVLLNPSSLSFFMEFMDRRKRLILVQFWLIVESFKNPLEEIASDDEDDVTQASPSAKSPAPSPLVVKTLREDLELFDSTYYSSPLIRVSPKYVQRARQFLSEVRGTNATAQQIFEVRRSVLRAQQQVYREMEEDDWPAFKRSDLFLNAAQDLMPDPDLSAGLASSVTSLGPAQIVKQPSLPELHEAGARTAGSAGAVERRMGLAAHADLFGAEDASDFGGGGGGNGADKAHQRNALFGERGGGARHKSSAMAGNLDILIGGRTQHAGPDGRTPLFRNDPLFDDAEEDNSESSSPGSEYVQVDKVDAIQSALASIIDEALQDPSKSSSTESLDKLGHAKAAGPSRRQAPIAKAKGKTRFQVPAQRGDRAAKKARLFDDDESSSGPDGESGAPPLAEVSNSPGKSDGVRLAAPGDLNLDAEVRRMSEKLDKLRSQEEILDALIRKAELTGSRAGELRLLHKSRNAVRREAREAQWQREQYELQLSENKLVAGQTQVSITGTTIANDAEGKEYAVYLIEVNLTRGATATATAAVASGWIVGRRYSEFWTLHQSLKERLSEVRALESEFPGKRLVGLVHAPFVDARKSSLERYLQALVRLPAACESRELRAFLSQSSNTAAAAASSGASVQEHSGDGAKVRDGLMGANFPVRGLVRSLFKGMSGVAEGLDDLIGIGPSMLDIVAQRLSLQLQSASSSTSSSSSSSGGTLLHDIPDIDVVSQAMDSNATPAELKEAAGAGTTYWTEPICDVFVEIFELKEKNNWLRRQAIVILLQQLFGSTVERKVRDVVNVALGPGPVKGYIEALKAGLWPGGELKQPTPPRSQKEKEELRESANRKLSTIFPEVAANLIGRENARRGSRRIFTTVQNKRLNKHLVYTLLELVLDELLR